MRAPLLLLLLSLQTEAVTPVVLPKTYALIRVSDGDTFEATDGTIHFKVRLAGIDAPEKAQPFSKVAQQRLHDSLQGKPIELRYYQLDPYNRIIAQVLVGGRDVGLDLVAAGLAEYYRPGSDCLDFGDPKARDPKARWRNYDILPYVEAEDKARAGKLGAFVDLKKYESPCTFRKNKKLRGSKP